MRGNETQRGEVDFQFAVARRHDEARAPAIIHTIGADAGDVNRRRVGVACDAGGINHHHPARVGKPDAAVGRFAAHPLLVLLLDNLDVVRPAIRNALDAAGQAVGKVVHALAGDPEDPAAGIHPEIPVIVRDNRVNVVVKQTVFPVNQFDLVVLDAADARRRPPPNDAVAVLTHPLHRGIAHLLISRVLLPSVVFDAENARPAGHPYFAIPAGRQVEHPPHRWVAIGENARREVVGADTVQVSANRHHYAPRVLGQPHRETGRGVFCHHLSGGKDQKFVVSIEQVHVAIAGFEDSPEPGLGQAGFGPIDSIGLIHVDEPRLAACPNASLTSGGHPQDIH